MSTASRGASCVTPISEVANKRVTTIEGLSGPQAAAVKKAWVALDVPQCGYCQSGQVMTAVALLRAIPRPTDAQIDARNGRQRVPMCDLCSHSRRDP